VIVEAPLGRNPFTQDARHEPRLGGCIGISIARMALRERPLQFRILSSQRWIRSELVAEA
jgi:hypothetical protein